MARQINECQRNVSCLREDQTLSHLLRERLWLSLHMHKTTHSTHTHMCKNTLKYTHAYTRTHIITRVLFSTLCIILYTVFENYNALIKSLPTHLYQHTSRCLQEGFPHQPSAPLILYLNNYLCSCLYIGL